MHNGTVLERNPPRPNNVGVKYTRTQLLYAEMTSKMGVVTKKVSAPFSFANPRLNILDPPLKNQHGQIKIDLHTQGFGLMGQKMCEEKELHFPKPFKFILSCFYHLWD